MCKGAVSRARNVHGRWDRTRREWEGLLTRNKPNPNTCVCTLEVDLMSLIYVLAEVDQNMMIVDKAHLSAVALANAVIKSAGDHATRLADAMKEGEQ